MSDMTPVFTRYFYSGPVQSVTLKAQDTTGQMVTFFEAILHPGQPYDLLDGHPIVEGFKALDLITPILEEGDEA